MKKYAVFFIIIFILVLIGGLYLSDKLGLLTIDQFEQEVFNFLNVPSEEEMEESEIDTTPMEIEIEAKERNILESQTAITVKANKEIQLKESPRYTLYFIKQEEDVYWYVVEANNLAVDDSNLRFDFVDEAGNEETKVVKVTRENYALPFGASKIDDWEGSEYVVDGDNLLTIIDKKHKLVDDYEPSELLNVSSDLFLYANTADIVVRKEVGLALKEMVLDGQRDTGKTLTILSGYRSHNDQVDTYTNNVKAYGQKEADGFSARPGFSDHQLGTVVDFYSPDTKKVIFSRKFDETKIGKWLLKNAHKYGFVQTYPKGSGEHVDYEYEPWQYRYIGIENAKAVKESGKVFLEWVREKTIMN